MALKFSPRQYPPKLPAEVDEHVSWYNGVLETAFSYRRKHGDLEQISQGLRITASIAAKLDPTRELLDQAKKQSKARIGDAVANTDTLAQEFGRYVNVENKILNDAEITKRCEEMKEKTSKAAVLTELKKSDAWKLLESEFQDLNTDLAAIDSDKEKLTSCGRRLVQVQGQAGVDLVNAVSCIKTLQGRVFGHYRKEIEDVECEFVQLTNALEETRATIKSTTAYNGELPEKLAAKIVAAEERVKLEKQDKLRQAHWDEMQFAAKLKTQWIDAPADGLVPFHSFKKVAKKNQTLDAKATEQKNALEVLKSEFKTLKSTTDALEAEILKERQEMCNLQYNVEELEASLPWAHCTRLPGVKFTGAQSARVCQWVQGLRKYLVQGMELVTSQDATIWHSPFDNVLLKIIAEHEVVISGGDVIEGTQNHFFVSLIPEGYLDLSAIAIAGGIQVNALFNGQSVPHEALWERKLTRSTQQSRKIAFRRPWSSVIGWPPQNVLKDNDHKLGPRGADPSQHEEEEPVPPPMAPWMKEFTASKRAVPKTTSKQKINDWSGVVKLVDVLGSKSALMPKEASAFAQKHTEIMDELIIKFEAELRQLEGEVSACRSANDELPATCANQVEAAKLNAADGKRQQRQKVIEQWFTNGHFNTDNIIEENATSDPGSLGNLSDLVKSVDKARSELELAKKEKNESKIICTAADLCSDAANSLQQDLRKENDRLHAVLDSLEEKLPDCVRQKLPARLASLAHTRIQADDETERLHNQLQAFICEGMVLVSAEDAPVWESPFDISAKAYLAPGQVIVAKGAPVRGTGGHIMVEIAEPDGYIDCMCLQLVGGVLLCAKLPNLEVPRKFRTKNNIDVTPTSALLNCVGGCRPKATKVR